MSFAQLPMHPMAFHAPDIVEEPAGKRQEPQTPYFVSFCSSAALHTTSFSPSPPIPVYSYLAGSGGDLDLRTLCALLADVSLGLALAGGSVLGLLGLLGGLSSSLLLLVLSDGLGASGRSGLGSHSPALLDDLEGSTNDGTLGLDGTASALLGNLLRDTLAVLSSVQNRPGNATGVLSLQEQ